jgi:hypothetical protein
VGDLGSSSINSITYGHRLPVVGGNFSVPLYLQCFAVPFCERSQVRRTIATLPCAAATSGATREIFSGAVLNCEGRDASRPATNHSAAPQRVWLAIADARFCRGVQVPGSGFLALNIVAATAPLPDAARKPRATANWLSCCVKSD